MSAPPFPFSGLVGQDDLRVGLLANAVDPGVGGVLVRGEKGTAKSTAVRALAGLLPPVEVVAGCPYSCPPDAPDPDCPAGPHPAGAPAERRPVRLVELPVGASADRLAGSLDLERALVEGVKAFEPGLLAAAHRGILYVDEVNLLADHLVDLLLDSAALGVNYVEREGVSVRHPARFLLVGTMNPEEGELRPQLLDRFGLSVEVRGSRDPSERAEVVRRRLAFEADPAGFRGRFAADEAALGERVDRARERLPGVRLPDRTIGRITAACAALEVDGLRADIVTAKASLALAALDGRAEPGDEHVRQAALLALGHRRRRGPLEQPGIDPEELERALGEEPGEGPDDPQGDPPQAGPPPREENGGGRDEAAGRHPAATAAAGSAGGATPPGEAGAGAEPVAPGPDPRPDRDPSASASSAHRRSPEAAAAGGARTDAPAGAFRAPLIPVPGVGRGAPGRRSRAEGGSGRAVGERPHAEGRDLAPLATLRAAAPHQRRRGRSGRGLELRAGDLRAPLRERREGNLVLFVVDASGSMAARRRMAAVKGAVLALLVDSYQRRDKVGLISFRGAEAEVVLPPTASVEVGARRLAELPTGGRTPLAAGLDCAGRVLATERVRDPRRRPLVLLVTDGRANAGRAPLEGARRSATRLVGAGARLAVLDSEDGPARLGLAAELAAAAGAPLLRLEDLAGPREIAGLARDLGRAAA